MMRFLIGTTLIIMAFIATTTSSPSNAQQFMRSNGNHHRGIYSQVSGPKSTPSKQRVWNTNARIVSQVVADELNQVYFGSADSHVYALKSNGELKWKLKTGGAVISTPAIRDDALYVGSWDHHMYSIERKTGRILWKFKTNSVISSSPAISNNGIVFVGSGDSKLYALSSENGALLWSHETSNAVYSSPAISSDDRVVFFGSWDGKIRALDTYSGKLIWEHVSGGAIDSSPTLSFDERTLYVGVWSGNVIAIETSSGVRKWTFRCGNKGVVASPSILSDGTVVIGSWNRKIHAIDPSSGVSKWELDVAEIVEGTAAIDREDNIFVGTSSGDVFSIRGQDGLVNWKHSFGVKCSISSVMSLLNDGTIVFGSDDGRVRFLSEGAFVDAPKMSSMAPPPPPSSSSSSSTDTIVEVSSNGDFTFSSSTKRNKRQWCEFRGGHANAYSGQSNQEGPERLSVMWTLRRGMSFSSSPVFDENERRMFVGNADGILYAFDLSSSLMTRPPKEVWKMDTGGTIVSTASVRDGKVFVGSWDQCIRALDASSGELIWTFHTNEPVSSSPTVHPDGTHLIVGSGDGRVISISTETGLLRWAFQAQGSVHTSPTISHDGDLVVISSWDHKIYALSTKDGSKMWEYETKDKIDSSALILENNSVILAGWDGLVVCLNRKDGSVIWSSDTKSGGVVSSPTLSSNGDLILVGTWSSEIIALDTKTGQIVWQTQTDSEIEASVLSASNGIAYVGTVSGTLYSFLENSGKILDKFAFRNTRDTIRSPVDDLSSVSIVSSALLGSNRHLYVSLTDGRLVAFQDASNLGTSSSLCQVEICARPMLSMDPSHHGRSPYSVPRYEVQDKKMNALLWSRHIEGGVVSSPSLGAFNSLYIGTRKGELQVLDTASGHMRWAFSAGSTIVSSPAISDDGTIYFGSWNRIFYALDASGNLKWKYETNGAISASPLLLTNEKSETHIYVGSSDGLMYKFDTNGRVVWKSRIGEAIYSSAAASSDQNTLYFGANDSQLYAIDVKSGEIVWSRMLFGKIEASPAVGSDGTIYVADFGGIVSAILPRDGSVKWKYEIPNRAPIVSSPTLDLEGTTYIGSKTKHAFAIRRDGTLKWSLHLNENVDSTPVLDRDGKLVFGGSKGTVYVVDSELGHLLFSFNMGSGVYASPVLSSNNVMFVTTKKGDVFAVAGDRTT